MTQTNHPLAKWIDARMKRDEFADKAGLSKSHLSLILQGKRGISFDLAQRIEAATGGEFSAADIQRAQKAVVEAAVGAA